MKNDTPDCEEYEIAAVQQVHGALEPAAAERLALHLTGCPDCRRFVEFMRRSQAGLKQRSQAGLADPGRAALRSRVAQTRDRILRTALVVLLIVALQFHSRGLASALAIGGLAALVALAGIFGYLLPQRRRALEAGACASEGELLAGLRVELEREIAALRQARGLRIALGLLCAATVLLSAGRLALDLWGGVRTLAPLGYLLPCGLAALLTLRLAHDQWRRLPRLEREREDFA